MFIASPSRRSGLVSWHAQSNQKPTDHKKDRLLFAGLTTLSQTPDQVTFSSKQPDPQTLALFNALRQKNHEELRLRLAVHPELANAMDPEDQTPILLEAVALGDINAATLLLEHGADSLRPNHEGITPIVLATVNGHVPMVELLLEKGAPLHSYYRNMPLMHLAVQAGQLNMLTALKKAGTDVNLRDAAKRTPLHMATAQENPEVAQWLLDNGAKLEAKDSEGYTPLHRAVFNESEAVFNVLHQAGADLNSENNLKLTPYLTAAGTGKVRLMKTLQAAGANTQALTGGGLTALHWAAGLNQAETLRHLLSPKQKGAEQVNLNITAGPLDDTPLHLAVAFQSNEAIEELVKNRKKGAATADWHIKNKNGKSPWDHAQKISQAFAVQWRHLAEPHSRLATPASPVVKSTPKALQAGTSTQLQALSEERSRGKADHPATRLPSIAEEANTDLLATHIKADSPKKRSPQTPPSTTQKRSSQSQVAQAQSLTETLASETASARSSAKSGKAKKKAPKKSEPVQSSQAQAKPELDEIDAACRAVYGSEVNNPDETFQDLINKHSETLQKLSDQERYDFLSGHLNALNVNNPYPIEIVSPANPSERRSLMATPLHVAILSSMPVKWIHLFLQKGADPTAKDTMGRTPFHIAAMMGNLEYLNTLSSKVKGGSKFRQPDIWKNVAGNTPLHEAARNGHIDATLWLLDKKFPVNVKNDNEETPLHTAANEGQAAVVSELLKHKANPETQNSRGRTPLHLAALTGNIDVLKAFADAPKKIFPIKNINDWRSVEGNTPLHEAARAGHLEAVQWLIDQKFPINEPNNDNETALHQAAAGGHTEVAKLLLDNGADPEVKTKDGMTPLHSATHTMATDTLEALLRLKKFNPNATLINGSPPLHMAVVNRDLTSVRLLLEYGANVNQAENGGRDALQLAVMLNDEVMVDELLKHGADPTHLDSEGENILHLLLGSRKNNNPTAEQAILKSLLRQLPPETIRKMVTTADKRFQNTPLHTAIAMGNLAAVKLLLSHGADPALSNCAGKNSLMAAVDNHFPAAVEDTVKCLLNQPDAQIKSMLAGKTNDEGANVLHLAAALNLTKAMNSILEKQKALARKGVMTALDINARDNKGHTPLHYAAMLGKVESIRFLLSEKADPTLLNKDKRSPLMSAIEYVPQGNLIDPQETLKTSQVMTDELLTAIQNQAVKAGKSSEEVIIQAVNHADLIGYTPLHLAATKGNLALLKQLLQHGADPTHLNQMGGSPLHIAADFENETVSSHMVEILLEAYYKQGGEALAREMVKLKDTYGVTPQKVATVLKRPMLAQRMRHYTPRPTSSDGVAETALPSNGINAFANRRVVTMPFSLC